MIGSLDTYGCTDIEFVEFNPNANIDNGTCSLLTIEGCTDTCNYDSNATDDDGSCSHASTYYNCDGMCINDTDGDGFVMNLKYKVVRTLMYRIMLLPHQKTMKAVFTPSMDARII